MLEPKLASGTYETDKYGEVPTINSVAVRGEDGTISVFVVNRSMEAANDFAIKLPEGFALSAVEAQTLHEDDLLAKKHAGRPEPSRSAPQHHHHVRRRYRHCACDLAAGLLDRRAREVIRVTVAHDRAQSLMVAVPCTTTKQYPNNHQHARIAEREVRIRH